MPERVFAILNCVVIRRVRIIEIDTIPSSDPVFSFNSFDYESNYCDSQFHLVLEIFSVVLCAAIVFSSVFLNLNLIEYSLLRKSISNPNSNVFNIKIFKLEFKSKNDLKECETADTFQDPKFAVMPLKVIPHRSLPFPKIADAVSIQKSVLLSKIDLKKSPKLVNDGNTSLVFTFFDKNYLPIAIFKPCNVRFGDGLNSLKVSSKKHIKNEFTSFLMSKFDHKNHSFLVPNTEIVRIPSEVFENHSIISDSDYVEGSLQEFVQNCTSCEDLGSSLFDKDQIHEIGILDIRILNLDRHSGNLLMKSEGESKRLIPIDHSLSFPTFNELKEVNFEWLFYNQSKSPFSETNIRLINEIDVYHDVKLLIKMGYKAEEIIPVFSSTLILKYLASKGSNLYEIASLIQRKEDRSEKSELEIMISSTLNYLNAEFVDFKDLKGLKKYEVEFMNVMERRISERGVESI